ncbi:MAG TPA: flagellar hook-associated protein FlgK [Acidobacteriota bacterium]|nr:flagellar hook-associated protein FlgK [Acidobacteriota bacterium]
MEVSVRDFAAHRAGELIAMSSIFSGLSIAQRSLSAQQLGLEITQRNVANANTPGYSKLRVNFEPAIASDVVTAQPGMGVAEATIESFRNNFIDFRISQELQGQGEQQAAFDALQQVEALFNDPDGQGIQSAMSDFFASFSALANTPESLSLRQQVIQRATALTEVFHQLYNRVKELQLQQDRIVSDTVQDINSISADVARLNAEIAVAHGTQANDESALRDERQRLLSKLSELMDISYYEDSRGMVTVAAKQGPVLVVGDITKPLELGTSPVTGLNTITQGGTDVTTFIQSGKLGGVLKVRDTILPEYLNSLDDLAAGLIQRVNAQHALGVDLNGVAGGNIFVPFVQPVPGSNTGAARGMAVSITDPETIAAAGPAAGPGSNANANLLAGIQNETFASLGTTPGQFYANLVYRIGSDGASAHDSLQTKQNLVQQLENQRDAFSGVNLDEEAVNIIRYQKAYQASARFVTVIDNLTSDLLRILGG